MANEFGDTSSLESDQMPQQVESMIKTAESQRRPFSRRWYDNNFFDDGFHFRFVSRTTGRIVELKDPFTQNIPKRAIPKASRQIRGMANLLQSQDPVPVIYPEKLEASRLKTIPAIDPETGQPAINPQSGKPIMQYEVDLKKSKEVAMKSGYFIEEEWKDQDLDIKYALMLILTMKHYISFLQVWPDPIEEAMKTQAYDAFDIYMHSVGITEIYDSPFIIKSTPKLVAQIRANEMFDKDARYMVIADNKYSEDMAKEAYLSSRYGSRESDDSIATAIQREAFIKEYMNADNRARIQAQANNDNDKVAQRNAEFLLKNRKDGDPIIRQVFCTSLQVLRDSYIDIPDYPFVDLRLEPGAIYGVPQIERFMDSNKSLDMVISRIERYIHTMMVGTWMKRKGESFDITNQAGGNVIEYESTPPIQGQMASIPGFVFNFMELLMGFIEEQGVTTTTLGKLPKGVKANSAIESLKESEFANLSIPLKMYKKSVQRTAEKMLDIADNHFVTPKTIYRMNNGEPDYFEVIGQNGIDAHKKVGKELSGDVVPIKRDYKVRIEIEQGMGFTIQGRRAAMLDLANFMRELAKEGYMNVESVKVVMKRLLETWQFGSTSEFMEAMATLEEPDSMKLTNEQIEQMKLAFLEVIKDMQDAGVGSPGAPGGGGSPQGQSGNVSPAPEVPQAPEPAPLQ